MDQYTAYVIIAVIAAGVIVFLGIRYGKRLIIRFRRDYGGQALDRCRAAERGDKFWICEGGWEIVDLRCEMAKCRPTVFEECALPGGAA